MTKNEITAIITSKAAEYGFEMEENSIGWNKKNNDQSYITIQIFQDHNIEKTDWENRKGHVDIVATASVSRMGGNQTPEGLLKIADEITRGARFVEEIQSMNLSYIHEF